MLCLSGFEQYSRWAPLCIVFCVSMTKSQSNLYRNRCIHYFFLQQCILQNGSSSQMQSQTAFYFIELSCIVLLEGCIR